MPVAYTDTYVVFGWDSETFTGPLTGGADGFINTTGVTFSPTGAVEGDPGNWLTGWRPAADISVSGVGVLIDEAVFGAKPSGEVGVCRIESADLGGRIEAYVSVMRIRRLGDQRLVGLRFESISDDELELIQEYNRKHRELPATS